MKAHFLPPWHKQNTKSLLLLLWVRLKVVDEDTAKMKLSFIVVVLQTSSHWGYALFIPTDGDRDLWV